LIDQLIERTQHVRAAMRVECLGLLTALVGVLAQALEPASLEKERAQHPAVAAAQRMLEQQIDYPWTLVELAYQLHIDRSYLVRLFRQHTGLAPMTFLAQRRAERAALLLRTTQRPVSAIGCAVGWHDLNQFNRRFKAVFGVSASVYRKSHERIEPAYDGRLRFG
jgi:AraC family L-rhamnose operon transcriptional activator RhaR